MGFLSKILKNRPIDDTPRDKYSTVERSKIPAEKINQMQRIEASKKYQKEIYKRFYLGYPEKPFISQDRELNTDWINQEMISLVPLENMTRYDDGLLPGHVRMLHWIQNSSQKRRIPSYFEYEYGIDFIKEREFLREHEYLHEDYTLTNLGTQAIAKHKNIIEKVKKKPKHLRSTPRLKPDMIKDVGCNESEIKRISLIKDFIDSMWEQNYIESATLKTDKGRRNRIQSFYDKLLPYETYMPRECVLYYKDLTVGSYVQQPLRIEPLVDEFASPDEDGDYELWIGSYGKHGLNFEEWKAQNGNTVKKSSIEKFTLYKNEVSRTADNYYELMYVIKNNWSILRKQKDYTSNFAKWFEQDCLLDIFLFNKMIAIDMKYEESVPDSISCLAADRLIKLYKYQGRIDEAVDICKKMIELKVSVKEFSGIIAKLLDTPKGME